MGKRQDSLEFSKIRIDAQIQPRTETKQAVIDDYAEEMRERRWRWEYHELPVVFFDGQDYWLASGFHRLPAAKLAGLRKLPCEIRDGSRRDAILFSVSTNQEHGLRRSNQDKERAVTILLKDEVWREWSNHQIAGRCGVSHGYVGKLRNELSTGFGIQLDGPRTYQRNGQTQRMNTGGIAQSNASRAGDEKTDSEQLELPPIGFDGTERIDPATGEIVTVNPTVPAEATVQGAGESPTPATQSGTLPTPAPRPEPTINDIDPNGVYIIKNGILVLDPYENHEQIRADYPMGAALSIGITALTGRAIYERHKLGTLNAKLVWPMSPAAKVVDPDLLPLSETAPASMKHHKGDRAWCATCDSKSLPPYHSRWINAVADIWHCLQCSAEYTDDVMEEDDMTVSPLPSRPTPKPAPVSPQAIPLFINISHDETMRSVASARIRGDELTLIRPKEMTDQEIAIWTRLRDGIDALLTEYQTQRLQAVTATPQTA